MPAKKKAVSLLLTIKLLNNCFVKKTCKSKSDFLIGRGLYNILRARTESGLSTSSCIAYRRLLPYSIFIDLTLTVQTCLVPAVPYCLI